MVRVAGSIPVVRSGREATGGMAEWLGKGLQNPVPRFDSGCRLSERDVDLKSVRAISSGGERFLDAEEVSGSNPLSPTSEFPLGKRETPHRGKPPARARGFSTPLLHQRTATPVLYSGLR